MKLPVIGVTRCRDCVYFKEIPVAFGDGVCNRLIAWGALQTEQISNTWKDSFCSWAVKDDEKR